MTHKEKTLREVVDSPGFKAAIKGLSNQEKGSISVALVTLQDALPALEKAGLSLELTIEPQPLDFN